MKVKRAFNVERVGFPMPGNCNGDEYEWWIVGPGHKPIDPRGGYWGRSTAKSGLVKRAAFLNLVYEMGAKAGMKAGLQHNRRVLES